MTLPTVTHASMTHHHHALQSAIHPSFGFGGLSHTQKKRYEYLKGLCPGYEITQRGRRSHLSSIYAFTGNLQKTTEILPAVIAQV
jgi:hypothetical protein